MAERSRRIRLTSRAQEGFLEVIVSAGSERKDSFVQVTVAVRLLQVKAKAGNGEVAMVATSASLRN